MAGGTVKNEGMSGGGGGGNGGGERGQDMRRQRM